MLILLARHSHEAARGRGRAFIAADTDSALAGAGAREPRTPRVSADFHARG